ncbi:hypothetical protein JOF29_005480 [Kribbella aluminosa]|uniref:Lipoprotein n=1 Tax=Kribbella aluminosa TaxID=416017 RepID=A0ABS4URX1_9ACTN|nr:hypothetical protein [Kribbella aluminosa]MBP2354370.1 hypothetical protein [Kribbella aluminosa]
MHHLLRRTATVAAVVLLTACAATRHATEPSPSTPQTTATSVRPTTFRYDVNQLQAALPVTIGRYRFESAVYVYPVGGSWTLRSDPLDGWTVVPAECRATRDRLTAELKG